MSGRAATVGAVALTVFLFGGLYVFGQWRRETRLESGPGDLRSSVLAQAQGPVLLSLETLEFSDEDSDETVWRATAYDARTGQRLARVKEVGWRGCAAASTGLVWCHTEAEGLEVLEVPSLRVRWAAAAVAGKLGQKAMDVTRLSTDGEGRLRLTLADGRQVRLDAESLNLTPEADTEPGVKAPAGDSVGRLDDLQVCSIPASSRVGLCRHTMGQQPVRLDRGDGFLRLSVIGAVKGGLLVMESTSLDDQVGVRQLVRLDDTDFHEVGRVSLAKAPGWSTPTPQWVDGGDLVLFAFGGETIGIDTRKPAELWRVRH